MKRFLLAACGAGLMAGVGCVHIQPVGPLAKSFTPAEPDARPAAGGKGAMPPKDADRPVPTLQPAPPPPSPALLVTPGEVTEANHQDAARRLMQEMEADRKAMESMPRYSEVSVVKGGK